MRLLDPFYFDIGLFFKCIHAMPCLVAALSQLLVPVNAMQCRAECQSQSQALDHKVVTFPQATVSVLFHTSMSRHFSPSYRIAWLSRLYNGLLSLIRLSYSLPTSYLCSQCPPVLYHRTCFVKVTNCGHVRMTNSASCRAEQL